VHTGHFRIPFGTIEMVAREVVEEDNPFGGGGSRAGGTGGFIRKRVMAGAGGVATKAQECNQIVLKYI